MKLPKVKKSTLVILMLLAVFAVIALMTTPLLRRTKPTYDPFSESGDSEEEQNSGDFSGHGDILLFDDENCPEKTYSAQEIADAFFQESSTPYKNVYLKDASSLDGTLPAAEWITLFGTPSEIDVPTKKEKAEFLNGILEELPERIEFPLSITVSEEHIPSPTSSSQIINWKEGNFGISAFFGSHYTYIDVSVADHLHKFYFDKQQIVADQTQSDEELAKSLNNLRLRLCQAFGVNLSDTEIVRRYDGEGKHGVCYLDVYFYNREAHPANACTDTPRSDYIRLSFDNVPNWKGDLVSDKLLTNVSIAFVKYYKTNPSVTRAKMLSLEEAEAMLQKGQIFGFHACELCKDESYFLDFSDYQAAELVYKSTSDAGLLPFYAFYKELGSAPNGNLRYALTYVPAFEVSGAEEYFAQQVKNHKGSSNS
ncbi:MAG: hypothetical protein E7599_06435 [Ruminococcaceae bacterium]|nr:hypothetical protein [Oscillospiraceae bacterium]